MLNGTWFYQESEVVHLCIGPYEFHTFCGHKIVKSKIEAFIATYIIKDYEWNEADEDCLDCLKCLEDAKRMKMPLVAYQVQHIKDMAALSRWEGK